MSTRYSKNGWFKVPMESGSFKPSEQGIQIGQLTATIDPASVAANTSAEQTFTVAGLDTGDFVRVSKPTATAGLGIVNARVSAANTLAITFMNSTAAPIDAASETYKILVVRVNWK